MNAYVSIYDILAIWKHNNDLYAIVFCAVKLNLMPVKAYV